MSRIQTIFLALRGYEWVGIFVARLSVGLVFVFSGEGKLFRKDRREKMLKTLVDAHVPFPGLNTLFVSTVEFVCGLLLLTGTLTRLACVMLMGVMFVAISTTAIKTVKASSAVDWISGFLYLPEVMYFLILFWLFLTGPGWFSVDRLVLYPLVQVKAAH